MNRMSTLVDSAGDTAYDHFVANDTMSSNGYPHEGPLQPERLDSDQEARSHLGEGFAVHSRQRLLAVAEGSLSAADYSRELADHVNARLARDDDRDSGSTA